MFNARLFITAVLAVVHVRFVVASFQPSSDYNIYKTTNLYNCTGHVSVSNVTIPNPADTLPQIEPCAGGRGWEQWSLFLHGTFPVLLRWTQGDPSSPMPSPAQFDAIIVDVNGTTVKGKVVGGLAYTDSKHVKQITIGGNSLTWDSDALWYNVSVNIDGYQLKLDSFAATLDTFHPNVAFHNGLLDQSGGWFGSVPLLRGQVIGNLLTPSNQKISLDGLSFMHHIFSDRPLPSYINKYAVGTIWGYSTTFYDSHVFYQTETKNGTVHEAAFLGRALTKPSGQRGFSSAWATYGITDDRDLYRLSVDGVTKGINASFSGCANTNEVPFVSNVTSSKLLTEFTDRGGGKTTYYSIVDGKTSAFFDGAVVSGAIAGIIEEYQVPSRGGGGRDHDY